MSEPRKLGWFRARLLLAMLDAEYRPPRQTVKPDEDLELYAKVRRSTDLPKPTVFPPKAGL